MKPLAHTLHLTDLSTLSRAASPRRKRPKNRSRPAICAMANIQSLPPRDRLWLKLRQRVRNRSKLGALPRPPLMPKPIPIIRCPYCVAPISRSCPPLRAATGTSVNSAVMSYFRTIPRSSVFAPGVLTSTNPKRDRTGTAWFVLLRCQPHVELNSNFVFGLDARFSRRLDPEISLLHRGLAGVAAVL